MRSFCTRWLMFAFAATLAWTFVGCGGDREEMSKSAPREQTDYATENEFEIVSEEVAAAEFPAEEIAAEHVTDVWQR